MYDLVLQILSISAITTTIALFFCGIPICFTIRKQGGIGDISGIPFLMGLLGGSFWLRYGFLKMDWTMIIVNLVGVSFFTIYCLFFLFFSWPKKSFCAQLGLVVSLILSMVVWIAWKPNLDMLGIVCMTFNIMNFGAPLAGLGVVLKNRNVSSLPFPMCCANFLVSSQWFFYGNLVSDLYVIVPNGIGVLLAIFQLLLFVILPMKEADKSPLEKMAAWFTARDRVGVEKDDVEKGGRSEEGHGNVIKKLMTASESRRESLDFIGRPPSYKSRSSSVPDIASLQSF
ncbi:unnamed protein product [Caenorhabditis angaria]|uniref:Sugar transporter SWEET n=1 Tax=Caenorhabditis angaria TaxID=860376 RepID=A0A9P1IUW8_9PELO|nr:unnamed protein product [Caenorhabditis angaria]